MILCCKICGNSFKSDTMEDCDYCGGHTEVLITDEEMQNISSDDLFNVVEALKGKYQCEENKDLDKNLWKLRAQRDFQISNENIKKDFRNRLENHMTTTGLEFSGYKIDRYFGVISSQVVMGTGLFSEVSAALDDILGDASSPFEEKIEKARQLALNKLKKKSVDCGGNAIMGVKFEYINFSGNIIGVMVDGTSVFVKRDNY